VNKASVSTRLKEISNDAEANNEAVVLKQWLELANEEAALKRQRSEAEFDLDSRVYAAYPKLSQSEIQSLVVDDKWLAAIDTAIHGEMDRISHQLARRVKELAERYETPLKAIVVRVAELEKKVNHHLERMGFAWN
jgi:type I restriction enzyme M protein